MDEKNTKVLDPDDPLMKRFQDALNEHLLRVDNKLSQEILEMESTLKAENTNYEAQGLKLYGLQQDIAEQQGNLEKLQEALEKLSTMRLDKEKRILELRESNKCLQLKIGTVQGSEQKLIKELTNLSSLQAQFAQWEAEIKNDLINTHGMSKRDAAVQRELIKEKQERDYLMFKMTQETWKLEGEIATLQEQLEMKKQEIRDGKQCATDSNADLETLNKDRKCLLQAWNSVLILIAQRDKVTEQLNQEKRETYHQYQGLEAQSQTVTREISTEMENNEKLTVSREKFNDELKRTRRIIDGQKEKVKKLEDQLMEVIKQLDAAQETYRNLFNEREWYKSQEQKMSNALDKIVQKKSSLEDSILTVLDEKLAKNKELQRMNKTLREKRYLLKEQELIIAKAENSYSANLLELEKFNALIANEKEQIEEMSKRNLEKEREMEALQMEERRVESDIGNKQRKIVFTNKKIEEHLNLTGGKEISTLDLKLYDLEKSAERLDSENGTLKSYWLRQENIVVSLTARCDCQHQELSLIDKQIMIMEQKNLRLTLELESVTKEKGKLEKALALGHQRMTAINAQLAAQKDLGEALENKNSIQENQYIRILRTAEMELINLNNQLNQLKEEQVLLEEELREAQRGSLTWEKKLQLAIETSKRLKAEKSEEGEIGLMRSEIHKMEMRMSHLRKVEEKLMQDMEFCVSRRQSILDLATAKQRGSVKSSRDQRIIIRKRLDDQKIKIKQMIKECNALEGCISPILDKKKELLEDIVKLRKILDELEESSAKLDSKSAQFETTKFLKLKLLICKQRKFKFFEDVKKGQYRLVFKNDEALNEELQKQRELNFNLKEIMNQSEENFPMLKNNIYKIRETLFMNI